MNYLNSFVEILREFTGGQKLFVLVLLLVFTSGTYIISKYIQRNSCLPVIKENMEMQRDFAEITKMLREERKQNAIKQEQAKKIDRSPASYDNFDSIGSGKLESKRPIFKDTISVPQPISFSNTNEKILKIAEKYGKE